MKRTKENLKSLVLLLLTVSLIVLSVLVVSTRLEGDSSGAVDISGESLLSALGLDFLRPLWAKNLPMEDFDASSLLYPTYIAYGDRMVCDRNELAELSYKALLCHVLEQRGNYFGGNLSSLFSEESVFIYFSDSVSSDLFMKLFAEKESARIFSFRGILFTEENAYFGGGNDTFVIPMDEESVNLFHTLQTEAKTAESVPAVSLNSVHGYGYLSESEQYRPLLAHTPVYDADSNSMDTALATEIAGLFGLHTGIPDENGLLFVGNNSNLSISKEGVLHLVSSRRGGGVALSDRFFADVEQGFSQKQICAMARIVLDRLSPYMAETRLCKVEYDESSARFLLYFTFVSHGLDVIIESAPYGAVFAYENGYFTDIVCTLTTFTESSVAQPVEPLENLAILLPSAEYHWVDRYYSVADSVGVFAFRARKD